MDKLRDFTWYFSIFFFWANCNGCQFQIFPGCSSWTSQNLVKDGNLIALQVCAKEDA